MRVPATVLLIAAVCLGAATVPTAAVGAPDSSFIIGADDVLDITLPNHPDLNRTLTVLPDGTITFPLAGRIRATGKTPDQLAAEIKTAVEKTKNNVIVAVAVKEVHSRRVRIAGAVKTPSGYDLKPNWRVLDLIAVAGGLTARPAHVSGRIVRAGGALVPLDLMRASVAPESSANPKLQSDDLVLLEEADPALNKVYVMGQVNKPGAVDLGDKDASIMSVLSQAGNPTELAALTKAYITRDGKEIPVNLRSIVVDGRPDESVRAATLKAGDVLYVPQIDRRIAVMGQVNKPGAYPLPEAKEMTALDALSLAGGQTPTADLHKAGVIRTVPGKKEPQVINIDVEKIMQKHDLAANIVLQPDDIVFVATKGEKKSDWRNFLDTVATLVWGGARILHP